MRRVCSTRSPSHDLFEQVRRGVNARGNGTGDHRTTEQAQRPGQRILLLPLRRSLRRGCGGRVVPASLSFFDPVHGRMRSGAGRFGSLVRSCVQKTGGLRVHHFQPEMRMAVHAEQVHPQGQKHLRSTRFANVTQINNNLHKVCFLSMSCKRITTPTIVQLEDLRKAQGRLHGTMGLRK